MYLLQVLGGTYQVFLSCILAKLPIQWRWFTIAISPALQNKFDINWNYMQSTHFLLSVQKEIDLTKWHEEHKHAEIRLWNTYLESLLRKHQVSVYICRRDVHLFIRMVSLLFPYSYIFYSVILVSYHSIHFHIESNLYRW